MAGSLQARVKTWVSAEDVTYSDLNAEFDNVLTAMQPLLIDDYSTNSTQMQVQTDPGEVGTESLSTTLAGEIARLRFMLSELSGETYWYTSPAASLSDLVNAVGTGLLDNRIASGRVRTGSDFPIFLVPNGSARTVKLDGTPTNFVYYIAGVRYTISSDVTITSLTAAPSSNNTCLVNDSIAADQAWTKYTGENGTEIPVDNMGTEISALVGKFAAFKIAGTTDEYFIAYVKSTTALSKAYRGYFLDSADAPILRAGYTNNDTITLMKLSWIFAKTDGTLTVTYNNPIWSYDEPSSPSLGDYWFDIANNIWKRYDIPSYTSAGATLVGVCIQDATNTVGARSFEFFQAWDSMNTVEVFTESNSQVKSRYAESEIGVWGSTHRYSRNLITWDMTTDLESGVTEGSSTYYYFYITESGDKMISDIRPYDRSGDLKGWYHPYYSWRCVGWAFNNASSNLGNVESFYNKYPAKDWLPTQTANSDIEVMDQIIPLDTSGGALTKYLPPVAVARGLEFTFVKTSNDTTGAAIAGVNSETINGLSDGITLYKQYDSVTLFSNGSSWYAKNLYLAPYIITATSSTKTPGATDNYHQLTGNSLALTAGTWRLFGFIEFGNSGSSPSYSEVASLFAGANGADTNVQPVAMSTLSGLTVLSVVTTINYPGVRTATMSIPAHTYIVKCTQAATVYLVSYATMSTAANARVTVYANAERIGLV